MGVFRSTLAPITSREQPDGLGARLIDGVARSVGWTARSYLRYVPVKWGQVFLARNIFRIMRHSRWQATANSAWGGRFRLDLEDQVQRCIYCFGVWEPVNTRVIAALLRPGDVFLDVGANVGYFSVLAARRVGPQGQVVAIEPAISRQEKLRQNLVLSQCTNVAVVEAAVGGHEGMALLHLGHATHMGQSSILPIENSSGAYEVRVATLPELVAPDLLRRSRVVKIDVEGLEQDVIDGLAPHYADLPHDGAIIMEVSPQRLESVGRTAQDLLDLLASWGYTAYLVPNEYNPTFYVHGAARRPRRLADGAAIDKMVDIVFVRGDAVSVVDAMSEV